MSDLAARIRDRLDAVGLSARAASLAAGCSADFVRQVLSGRCKSPRGENLVALAQVLQCPVQHLLGDGDEPVDQALPVKPGKIQCEDCLWWGRERAHDRDYPAGSCRGGLPRSVETFPLTYINPDGARFNAARGRWPWTMFDDWCSHAVWKGEAK